MLMRLRLFSLQAPLSIITAAGSLLLVLPSYMDANMMTGLPSHANLGSCSNSYRTDTAQRIGLVHDWRSHIGCCDGPDDVCRERVDRYSMGFWGERVADPFLCGPVITYSTLYSGRFPFLMSC